MPHQPAATPHTIAGYFDDPEALAKAVASYIASANGIYITANEFNPALLARAANRLKDRQGRPDHQRWRCGAPALAAGRPRPRPPGRDQQLAG